jgi:hypothetical protein
MEIEPPLTIFRPLELQVLASKPWFVEGQPFEFGYGNIIVHELGSFGKGFKNSTIQTSTPKSMEEVVTKVMQVDKVVELF